MMLDFDKILAPFNSENDGVFVLLSKIVIDNLFTSIGLKK